MSGWSATTSCRSRSSSGQYSQACFAVKNRISTGCLSAANASCTCPSTVSSSILSAAIELRSDCLGHAGRDLEPRRLLQVLLDRTQLCRPDQRVAILLGKGRRHLDLKVYLLDHAIVRVAVYPLDDADPLGRQVPLPAEAEHVDAGAGTDRGQEHRKG